MVRGPNFDKVSIVFFALLKALLDTTERDKFGRHSRRPIQRTDRLYQEDVLCRSDDAGAGAVPAGADVEPEEGPETHDHQPLSSTVYCTAKTYQKNPSNSESPEETRPEAW